MSTTLLDGARSWSLSRDEEGHRTYFIKWLVAADSTDGPANVLQTPGLPLPGSIWYFDNDLDLWAWCKAECQIAPHEQKEGEPTKYWTVTQTFTTKPYKRCQDQSVEDPLLEPPKISGGYIKYTEEATHDRFGSEITNSAWEQFRGESTTFDANRPTIRIEQNVAQLDREVFEPMVDTVNDTELWGFPPRCIKLSNVSWIRNYYGLCEVYYTRTLEFDVNVKHRGRDLEFDAYILEDDDVLRTLPGDNVNFTVLDLHATIVGAGIPDGARIVEIVNSYTVVIDAVATAELTGDPVSMSRFDDSGFDRWLLDEGTKALNGHWGGLMPGEIEGKWYTAEINGEDPDPANPSHFIKVQDTPGNLGKVLLNGHGVPCYIAEGTFYYADSGAPSAPGTDYAVDDLIVIAGGTSSTTATFKVAAIGTAGAIATLTVHRPGFYTIKPANPVAQASTTGLGTGATITVTWLEVSSLTEFPGYIRVEKYEESDFFELGIPALLE